MLRQALVNLIAASAFTVVPQLVHAQTVVASTFGPSGGPYQSCPSGASAPCFGHSGSGLAVYYGQGVSAGFGFTGESNANLFRLRLALVGDGNYFIGLWQGGLNDRTLLESWTWSRGGLATLLSASAPVLVNGGSYWITATSTNAYANTGWFESVYRGGYAVMGTPSDSRSQWAFYNTANQMAYEVSVTDAPPPVIVTPEPSSVALLATGLVILGIAARRRRALVA